MSKEILNYLDDYEFDYKDKLNLPKNVLFGLEIEYENLKKINFHYLAIGLIKMKKQ